MWRLSSSGGCGGSTSPCCAGRWPTESARWQSGSPWWRWRARSRPGWAANSSPSSRRAIFGSGPLCRRRSRWRQPEVITVVSQHGRPDDGSDAAGFNNAEFFAPLRPAGEWRRGMTKERLVQALQSQLSEEFPGVGFNFSQSLHDNIEEQLSGVKGANSVKIIGPDLGMLERIAAQVLEVMEGVH